MSGNFAMYVCVFVSVRVCVKQIMTLSVVIFNVSAWDLKENMFGGHLLYFSRNKSIFQAKQRHLEDFLTEGLTELQGIRQILI